MTSASVSDLVTRPLLLESVKTDFPSPRSRRGALTGCEPAGGVPGIFAIDAPGALWNSVN